MPSIIIPARNGFEATSACLGSVLYSVSRLNLRCEFVLVDDASYPAERIVELFRRHRADARGHETKIIRSREHQHYTGVFSIGLHFATRDLVFFISNDMVVPPSFFQAVMLVSSLSRDFGIVRGTSNYVDSHPEHRIEPSERPTDFRGVDAFSRSVFSAAGCGYVEDGYLRRRNPVETRIDRENRRFGSAILRLFRRYRLWDARASRRVQARLREGSVAVSRRERTCEERNGPAVPDVEPGRDHRMALVEAAYCAFREKWNVTSPQTWNGGAPLDFPGIAQSNAGSVPLNYPCPGFRA